jgi:hypothetical protein
MSWKIVLTGIVGLAAFFWILSMNIDLTSAYIEPENPIKIEMDKWSSNSQTLALSLVATIILGIIASKKPIIGILGILIVVVGAWMVWT